MKNEENKYMYALDITRTIEQSVTVFVYASNTTEAKDKYEEGEIDSEDIFNGDIVEETIHQIDIIDEDLE